MMMMYCLAGVWQQALISVRTSLTNAWHKSPRSGYQYEETRLQLANMLEMYKQSSKKRTHKSKPLHSKLFPEDM